MRLWPNYCLLQYSICVKLLSMGKRGPRPTGFRNKSIKKPSASNFRSTTRWKVDYDYVDKLGPEEQAYLAQFSDEYYAGDFHYSEPFHDTKELKRERYNAQNHNWNDAMTRSGAAMSLFPLDFEPGPDLSSDLVPSPSYQREAEYKAALTEYRKLVDTKQRTELQQRRLELLGSFVLSYAESDNAGPEDGPRDNEQD